MRKLLLLMVLVLFSGGAIAQEQEQEQRFTADELNAVAVKTAILIRCTQESSYNTYYNPNGRGALAANSIVYWVPAGDGAFYITKGDGENDYLQTGNITTFGAQGTAAKFHAVKPTGSGSGVTNFGGANCYENEATGGAYWIRLAFADNSKWFNFNGNKYDNAGTGVWTVQNVYKAKEQLKQLLTSKLGEAQTLYDGLSDNTFEEAVALQTAMTNAQGVLDAAESTEEDYITQTDNLQAAMSQAAGYPFVNRMVKEITEGRYYIYYMEGETKHYLQTTGRNSVVTTTENPTFYTISAGTTENGQFTKAYALLMNDLYISNTSQNATNIETKGDLLLWSSQVIFEMNGKCAIRLTNATAVDGWHGNYVIGKGTEANTTIALDPTTASIEDMFIWQIEEVVLTEAEIAAIELGDYLTDFYAKYYDNGWRFNSSVNNYSQPAEDQPLNEAYEEVKAFYEAIDETTTASQINEQKAILEDLLSRIIINQPESGKFYRLRCVATGMKYLQSTLHAKDASTNRFKMISGDDGKTEAATFCYYNGGLVAYTQPQYISHESNKASYSMTPLTVLFEQNNQNFAGQYNIKVGNRYLYGDGEYSDSGDGNPDARAGYRWWLEEVTTLPVTFGEALAATLYAPVALTIPAGVTAYAGSVSGEYVVLTEVSTTIPANTGVILMAEEAKSYDFAVTTTENTVEDNVLTGTVATINTPDDANIYTLQAPENVLKMKLYNGTTLAGFKAYLSMTASPVQAFKLDLGEATGIESILNDANGKMVIYDMNGRRVQQMSKGLYIVNGKKVLVK